MPRGVWKRTEEQRKAQAEIMRKVQKKYNAENRAKPVSPEVCKMRSEIAYRKHHCSCPFNMVDGIRLEIQKMDRFNTHSGVITEDEMREISEH